MNNKMILRISAISENEAFLRTCVAAFMLPSDPTVEVINDVKTAVSEAVTNSVVHAYPGCEGEITLVCEIDGNYINIEVRDEGVGIENVEMAVEPFFTTKAEDERSGLGFTVIKSFMDEVKITSERGVGTTVVMKKKIA